MGDSVRVGLWGAEDRFRRMLNLFFKAQAADRFVVSELAEAELAIVDIDGFDAERQWRAFREQCGSLPALILSVHERRFPGALSVLKPVQTQELLAALERLRPEAIKLRSAAPGRRPDAATAGHLAAPHLGGAVLDAARKLSESDAQPHSECVRLNERIFQRAAIEENPFYDPADQLQGIVTRAVDEARRTAQGLIIRGLGQDIVVIHRGSQVWTRLSDPQLCALCHVRYDARFAPHLFVRGEAIGAAPRDVGVLPSDAFLWKVALWSARGRLPLGVDPDRSFRLKRWPNLTRWVRQPHDMQLAALWLQQAFSPREVSARFGIHRGYVNAFFSACLALDLLEAAPRAAHAEPSFAGERHVGRGFLHRFIAFLRGKAR